MDSTGSPRKLGELPELCDINFQPMFMALANYIEANIRRSGRIVGSEKPSEINGFILRADMIALVRKHFNLQRQVTIQEPNILINTVIEILVGVNVLEDTGASRMNHRGYRTQSSSKLRELAAQ